MATRKTRPGMRRHRKVTIDDIFGELVKHLDPEEAAEARRKVEAFKRERTARASRGGHAGTREPS